MPLLDVDVYSVMNRPPPETARPSTPSRPFAPAVIVVVLSATFSVIHENSPGSATIVSPGSSPTSSTGRVVPMILDCIPEAYRVARQKNRSHANAASFGPGHLAQATARRRGREAAPPWRRSGAG